MKAKKKQAPLLRDVHRLEIVSRPFEKKIKRLSVKISSLKKQVATLQAKLARADRAPKKITLVLRGTKWKLKPARTTA